MTRKDLIERNFELISKLMGLRRPQREALRAFADLLLRFPKPLRECSPEERLEFASASGQWAHRFHVSITFELATGVGKTRLMGAIMALLFRAGEATTFLILAPRRAVLRRFDDALNPPPGKEYLFAERSLVPEPKVIRSANILDPDAVSAPPAGQPVIYLLSPQLIASSERFRKRDEITGRSPGEFLASLSDLVVFVDEAHHVARPTAKETAVWTQAIRDLAPAMQLGFTATPRDEAGTNVIYRYPLSVALAERRYTKAVELHVESFPKSLLDTPELDRQAIEYGLKLLERKEREIAKCAKAPFPNVKPIAVIFARDTTHAGEVTQWLIDSKLAKREEVLETHSNTSKSEEELERLLEIEKFDNPVRVVVNVQELTEGWDVTNVYVIVPLRAMATFQGALQAIGRGLRLPAGERVDHAQLDRLEVVLFGRETLASIINDAKKWAPGAFGARDRSTPDVTTVSLAVPMLAAPSPTVRYREASLQPPEVKLSLSRQALGVLSEGVIETFDLAELERLVDRSEIKLSLHRDRFVQAAATHVIRELPEYLSDELHSKAVRALISDWLDWLVDEQPNGRTYDFASGVPFNPQEVGTELAKLLERGAERGDSHYVATEGEVELQFGAYTMTVDTPLPNDDGSIPAASLDDVETFALGDKSHFTARKPYRGWDRAVHAVYAFDSSQEARLAVLLSGAPKSELVWWARNEPRVLRIETPAGAYHPDFITVFRNGDGSHRVRLIEVKDETRWLDKDSDARLKAEAAAEWCALQTELTGMEWSIEVAASGDVDKAASWVALEGELEVVRPREAGSGVG